MGVVTFVQRPETGMGVGKDKGLRCIYLPAARIMHRTSLLLAHVICYCCLHCFFSYFPAEQERTEKKHSSGSKRLCVINAEAYRL